jgi:protein-L-isoaspartate O-methyltransferase
MAGERTGRGGRTAAMLARQRAVGTAHFLASRRRVVRIMDYAEIRPGVRVLEIGTGWGFSAMVMAASVGPGGGVISLDPDPVATLRARRLHSRVHSGAARLAFVTGAVERGWPATAPYEVILCWRAVRRLPAAWLAQCIPGRSTIVTPIVLAGVPTTVALLQTDVDECRRPVGAHLIPDPDFDGAASGFPTEVQLRAGPYGSTAHLTGLRWSQEWQ